MRGCNKQTVEEEAQTERDKEEYKENGRAAKGEKGKKTDTKRKNEEENRKATR